MTSRLDILLLQTARKSACEEKKSTASYVELCIYIHYTPIQRITLCSYSSIYVSSDTLGEQTTTFLLLRN